VLDEDVDLVPRLLGDATGPGVEGRGRVVFAAQAQVTTACPCSSCPTPRSPETPRMPDQRPVAIANTSPLQYLHRCGLSDLLPKMYQEVPVPCQIHWAACRIQSAI
jgi:hypothetical protein